MYRSLGLRYAICGVAYIMITIICGCDNLGCYPEIKRHWYNVTGGDRTQLIEVARSQGLTGTVTDVRMESYEGLDYYLLSVKVDGISYYDTYFVTKTGGVWTTASNKIKSSKR